MDISKKIINGKAVSKISLGTVQLGLNYGIANNAGQPSLERSFAILDKALNGGITALDTARMYGESEDVLGKYLKGKNNDNLFLTTKYKCMVGEDASYQEVEKDVFTSVETSLEKLGVNKIDCLLIHNGLCKGIYQGKNIAKAFEKLVAKNYVSMCGLSQGRYAEELEDVLTYDVLRAVQTPMNVFDLRPIKSGIFDKLYQKGINIFVRSVFFQGLFFLDLDNMENKVLKGLIEKPLTLIREVAKAENMTIAELAISYIRDIEGVTSLVLGADNENHVEENLKYLSSKSISDEGRKIIEKGLSDLDVLPIMVELAKPKK